MLQIDNLDKQHAKMFGEFFDYVIPIIFRRGLKNLHDNYETISKNIDGNTFECRVVFDNDSGEYLLDFQYITPGGYDIALSQLLSLGFVVRKSQQISKEGMMKSKMSKYPMSDVLFEF